MSSSTIIVPFARRISISIARKTVGAGFGISVSSNAERERKRIAGLRKHTCRDSRQCGVLVSTRSFTRWSASACTGAGAGTASGGSQSAHSPTNQCNSNTMYSRSSLPSQSLIAVASMSSAAGTQQKQPPSTDQLRILAFRSGIPMIGFGIMDNMVMITA